MVAALYYAVIVTYILVWRSLALELVWARLKLQTCKAWRRSRERCKRLFARAGSELQDRLAHEPEPEPELAAADMKCSFALTEHSHGHGWQFRAWENGKGHWQDFGPADQQKLSDAHQDGARMLVLARGEFEYEIDLLHLVQKNKSTGRQRKIRAPARSLLYRYRFTRSFLEHSWQTSLTGVVRVVLLYLLVGYTFLAGTSVEPIACQRDLDMSSWIEAAPSIECNWCKHEEPQDSSVNDTSAPGLDGTYVDDYIHITYMQLASLSIAFFTLYGFGTPILFGVILVYHRDALQSNQFVKRYGFLVTKMKTEYYL